MITVRRLVSMLAVVGPGTFLLAAPAGATNPTVSLSATTLGIVEGNSGTVTAAATVHLSAPPATP